jgi:hypothetical protein
MDPSANQGRRLTGTAGSETDDSVTICCISIELSGSPGYADPQQFGSAVADSPGLKIMHVEGWGP